MRTAASALICALTSAVVFGCTGWGQSARGKIVSDRPVPELWSEVGALLQAEGFHVQAHVGERMLVTDWKTGFAPSSVAGVWTRVIAFAQPLGGGRHTVRIYREQVYTATVIPTEETSSRDPAVRESDSTTGRPAAAMAPPSLELGELNAPHGARRRLYRWHAMESRVAMRLAPEDVTVREAPLDEEVRPEEAEVSSGELEATLCGEPIAGIDGVLAPRETVLFGEIPGTNEAPRFIGTAACTALSRGQSVTLLLDVPAGEQPRLDAYFRSDAGPAAREELLNGLFWRRDLQDGRSSRAMLQLLETSHGLKSLGYRLNVVAVDEPGTVNPVRSLTIGRRVLEARRSQPSDLVMALLGNVHVYVLDTPEPQTAASYLSREGVNFIALDMSHLGGEAWTCTNPERISCGAKSLEVTGKDVQRWHWGVYPTGNRNFHVRRFPRRMDGYDGTWFLSTVTASPPAVR